MQPRVLGKYEILDVLGTGGMGTVYRALDPVLQRMVAIKLLNGGYGPALGSDDVRARFRTEARAIARFNHPSIVSVYDFSDTDPAGAFLVMEFVDGFTLDHYLDAQHRGGLAHAFELMTQLLDGLGYAHSRDIVHRDIKPSNLLVTRDGQLKITDFGIAKVGLMKQTQTGMAIGTPEYMAPEQYTGGTVDRRCDLHAAGTLFFQLLAGRPPFNGTTTQVMYQICNVTPDPVSSADPAIPKALDPVLAKALAKNPQDRFQTAKDFSDAIKAVSKALGITSAQLIHSPAIAPATRLRVQPKEPDPKPTDAPPGWSPQDLAEIEQRLAVVVGPLARVQVKRAAALTRDRDQLLQELANGLKSDAERTRFLKGAIRAATPHPAAAQSRGGGIAPGSVERTKQVLARYMGPIAAVLVNKTVPLARDEADLHRRLADRINDPGDRDKFLAEIARRR